MRGISILIVIVVILGILLAAFMDNRPVSTSFERLAWCENDVIRFYETTGYRLENAKESIDAAKERLLFLQDEGKVAYIKKYPIKRGTCQEE
jgi:hypothetical protein